MFFVSRSVSATILAVIDMSWDSVDARAAGRPFHSLTFRLEGGATLFSKDCPPLQAPEGSVCFGPANYDFAKRAGRGRIIAIHFLSDSPLPERHLCFHPRNPERFRERFLALHRVWTEKQFGYEYEARILFDRILLEIEREWAEQRPSLANEKLAQACRYLHAHITDSDLSVQTLCAISGMSDTYFRAQFRREFGMTPIRYINRLRLRHAIELLQSGYYTVGEVADLCGFASAQYFSAFVTRESGVSPQQHRRTLAAPTDLSQFRLENADGT
ncbi:MAG: helix-turn-helix transcriptional regulator [Oscillospiraceae bacterium]|nr:helix-turn-helix transcriptional regulator [Oscillospiraceae bacterium]